MVAAISEARAQDPSFVGRVEQIDFLMARLAPGNTERQAEVTTVGGLGGICKSTLARLVAARAELHSWFPGGVIEVDMRGGGLLRGWPAVPDVRVHLVRGSARSVRTSGGVWLFCVLAAVAVSFTWGTWWAVPCALLPLVGALGLLDRFTPTPGRVKVG